MFASLLAIGAAQLLPVVVPFGKPTNVERPIAPIESSGPMFAAQCKDSTDFERPAPPVRIFGNTYLVGTCGISSIFGRRKSWKFDSMTRPSLMLIS